MTIILIAHPEHVYHHPFSNRATSNAPTPPIYQFSQLSNDIIFKLIHSLSLFCMRRLEEGCIC